MGFRIYFFALTYSNLQSHIFLHLKSVCHFSLKAKVIVDLKAFDLIRQLTKSTTQNKFVDLNIWICRHGSISPNFVLRDADAQHLAKKSAIQFYQLNFWLKFVQNLPNLIDVCQAISTKKFLTVCEQNDWEKMWMKSTPKHKNRLKRILTNTFRHNSFIAYNKIS